MIRLGLCCKFFEEPIRFRSTTATYLKRLAEKGESPFHYVDALIKHNIATLRDALDYCHDHSIGCFRIGSDFMPVSTHPDLRYALDDLPSGGALKEELKRCGKKAKEDGIRLTFHPDQFVVLNSPREEVVMQAIVDLEYHAELAILLDADVINIHCGGGYGDKKGAIERFKKVFHNLSLPIKKRLTLENDDKVYMPSDLLPLCLELNIPLTYDVHHHRCKPDHLTIEEATQGALKTWDREPLFHLSSPREGWDGPKPHRHHDYISLDDFPRCWKEIDPLTVEVEAKAKEKAVLQLQHQLNT